VCIRVLQYSSFDVANALALSLWLAFRKGRGRNAESRNLVYDFVMIFRKMSLYWYMKMFVGYAIRCVISLHKTSSKNTIVQQKSLSIVKIVKAEMGCLPAKKRAKYDVIHKKLMHRMRHIIRVQWRLSNCCGALATWCTCFIDLFGSLYGVCIMKDLLFSYCLHALFNICQVDNSKRVECFVRVKHYWVYDNFTLNHLR